MYSTPLLLLVLPNPTGLGSTVTFSGTSDQTVTCNNATYFYQLVVDKGTDRQSTLTVNSANTSYFRLYGPTNLEADATNFYSKDALSIQSGTLQLTGNINIPNLTVSYNSGGAGYFPIPVSGALWLNGAGVTVNISDMDTGPGTVNDETRDNKDGRILINGLLRVTAGTLNGGFSRGLGSLGGGSFWQDGGTVNVWQFRPKASGTGIFSYKQTGGTFNVGYGFALSGGIIDSMKYNMRGLI